MKAEGKRRFRHPAFSGDKGGAGETASGIMQSTSRSSLVLAAIMVFGVMGIGLGCGRQPVKRTSPKGTNTGQTTPTPSKEHPLDLREVLASPSTQQARKTRGEVEDFRRKNIKGFKLPFPSVTSPRFFAADAVLLPDTVDVLGISTNGVSRAYLVVGMWEMRNHVVHDNLAGQPITVTYCDVNDCAYAYQRKNIAPEDFHVGGWDGQDMLLLIQGKHYAHPKVPLPAHPIKRTTWGKWKALHPNTKIYLGFFSEKPKNKR